MPLLASSLSISAKRLGILGGTFNPIHFAHLRLAEEARERCALDQVLFLPAAHPPHKQEGEELLSFNHRLAMVAAAIADNPAFTVSDLECRRQNKSYSVQTLEILRTIYPDHDFFFIIGMDSFRDLGTWWEYRRLFPLTNLVITRRPGIADKDLHELLPVAIRDEFCYDSAAKNLVHSCGTRIIPLDETYLDISSTGIRRHLAAGRSIRYLTPPAVVDYIVTHGLYRRPERS